MSVATKLMYNQLEGKEHIGEFGLANGIIPPVFAFPLQVIEIDTCPAERVGGYVDDTGWCAGFDGVEQQVGE